MIGGGQMIIKDIPKPDADRLAKGIYDLRPEWKLSIMADDIIRQIGLSPETICSIQIEAAEEEIDALVDEIDQMEIDAYNFSDESLRNPTAAKRQAELESRYGKYAIIEHYLSRRY